MKYYELFKKVDGENVILAGHFSKEEYWFHIQEGYRKKPQENVNKFGMRVLNEKQK